VGDTEAPYDVIGHGLACVDDLLLLSNIPAPEGRAGVLRREQHGGGMAATAVVAVARLGGRAGFVTKVGDDRGGEFILEDFRRYGVDVSRIVVEPEATSHLTVVLVDAGSGARSFLGQRGSIHPLQPEQLDRDYLSSGTILHLSDADPPALHAARWAKEAGREVCFDGTHFYPAVLDLIPHVEYLIVSRFFASEFVAHQEGRGVSRSARMFAAPEPSSTTASPLPAPAHHPGTPAHPSGTPAKAPTPPHHGTASVTDPPELSGEALLGAAALLTRLGPPVVVVTEGERGSWCVSPEGQFHTPAFPVAAVDTTGAGDVFHGAFLFARSRGWDLRPALRLASATAALKCRALGGRAGIPTLEEARALAEG
jgi:sulfofructose kinase